MYNDPQVVHFESALDDFHQARRRASLQAVLARLRGKSIAMLSYDEVRARLGGIEEPIRELKDIPLDAIIGTVSRYADFSRTLLPLRSTDSSRWARVRVANDKMEGLPPIEVYQIGDAYFILDGHHRASVAREMGSKHIQAYVRQVRTRVPLSPTDQVEDVILKAEYTAFLEKTRLDESRPEADLHVTVPGEYDTLLEHISVHRYYMGIEENREVPFTEAATHWFDTVYRPVARIIHQRNLLKDFPRRTEADLYIWIMEHRAALEDELGWRVNPDTALQDLSSRSTRNFRLALSRVLRKLVDTITPEEIEPSPPPGAWRRQREEDLGETGLFRNVMVALPGDETGWQALDLALSIAEREKSLLGGLYVTQPNKDGESNEHLDHLRQTFETRCRERGVDGRLAVESGNVTRLIFDRSFWADLLVMRLLYPPPLQAFRRLRSGLRSLIRLSTVPLLVCPPGAPADFRSAVLAYGGGPRSDEALFVATYLASCWHLDLTVVAVDRSRSGDDTLLSRAWHYLETHNVSEVHYKFKKGDPARNILQVAEGSELIIMGGYESGLLREILFGSTVDRVLWSAKCAVLICR